MTVRWLWLVQADTPPGNGGMWPLIGGLLGFVAILLLSWLGLRALSKRNLLSARGRHMQVVDRMVVGRDSMILLVRVGGRLLVTGLGKDGFRTLCELESQELEDDEPLSAAARRLSQKERQEEPPQGSPAGAESARGFWARFLHNLKINMGLLKNTPPQRPEPAGQASSFQNALRRSQEELAHTEGREHRAEDGTSVMLREAVTPPPERVEDRDRPDARLTPGFPQLGGIRNRPLPQEPENDSSPMGREPEGPVNAPDYNQAIERMQSFSRMEIEAKTREEPTAVDNMAFLQAARAYAEQQRQGGANGERTPPGAQPGPPKTEDTIESLSDRVRMRTQRLSRRLEHGGGQE